MNNSERSLDQSAGAENLAGAQSHVLKEYEIATNGISLHVTEQGEGPAVLFCHGFPDTSYTWRRQMKAVASAGFRAIAPDMRGYGRSSVPADAALYAPPHTAGDLVGLLDALHVSSAVIVGHEVRGLSVCELLVDQNRILPQPSSQLSQSPFAVSWLHPRSIPSQASGRTQQE